MNKGKTKLCCRVYSYIGGARCRRAGGWVAPRYDVAPTGSGPSVRVWQLVAAAARDSAGGHYRVSRVKIAFPAPAVSTWTSVPPAARVTRRSSRKPHHSPPAGRVRSRRPPSRHCAHLGPAHKYGPAGQFPKLFKIEQNSFVSSIAVNNWGDCPAVLLTWRIRCDRRRWRGACRRKVSYWPLITFELPTT